MPSRPARTYALTPALVAANVGTGVLCLAPSAIGRSYRLHARRPSARLNRRPLVSARGVDWRADLPSGANHVIEPVAEQPPGLIRVDISGPIEQRAGYHDPCAGWTDGHDAICERLCAAFREGDVLLVVDSPGGAAAGLQQAVRKAAAVKAEFGRRATGWPDIQAGSAAVWWMLGICDEVFLPEEGQIGSIGARGCHVSIAEALAKEGVEYTYFADPPEKVAFAPERKLDETGMSRGMRDVHIAADAFRAAVVTSPLGQRHGLTPEGLIALGADMLTGQAAVDAGLADGVAAFDEVVDYALAQAGREEAAVRE